jgi:hypothetical protein
VSELERWDSGEPSPLPDRRPGEVAVDRNRQSGLELTPEERVARRRNRRLLLGVAVPSILILLLALIATQIAWNNEPTGPKAAAPPGYRAVRDGYFSYAVPRSWSNNGEFTDQTGDVETSGPSGWAAEHIAYQLSPPVLGARPPSVLQAFGMPHPEPFDLSDGRTIPVKGAAAAFAYSASRPGGWSATVIDAWNSRAGVELWLIVHAPPDVTERVVSSLLA